MTELDVLDLQAGYVYEEIDPALDLIAMDVDALQACISPPSLPSTMTPSTAPK